MSGRIRLKPIQENSINCFTDGSKTEQGTGCAYITKGNSINSQQYFNLNHKNSVFQAEIYAIQKACEDMLEKKIEEKQITIHIDSQAAIRALDKYITKSKTVKEAKIQLNKLSKKNEVKLSWIPAHIGHAGKHLV